MSESVKENVKSGRYLLTTVGELVAWTLALITTSMGAVSLLVAFYQRGDYSYANADITSLGVLAAGFILLGIFFLILAISLKPVRRTPENSIYIPLSGIKFIPLCIGMAFGFVLIHFLIPWIF